MPRLSLFIRAITTSLILNCSNALAIDFTLGEDATVVAKWNAATLEAIGNTPNLGPTPDSRALGMLHSSIFDAWAAYDEVAIGTQLGDSLKVPSALNTEENKNESISFAAYTTLIDIFPSQVNIFDDLMADLGYQYTTTTDIETAAGIGNIAANALLDFRHQDGSNQLNNYADTSGYEPVNSWNNLINPNHWQPLSIDNGENIQEFLTPHWGEVIPFALTKGDQYLPPPPSQFGTTEYVDQALEIIEYSAKLTDREKVIAEYWADGPATVLPPGHWNLFAQYVSQRDEHSLDDDVKMFFALGNAVFDAGIAAWDAKEYYDYVRPITAIQYLAENNLLPDGYTTEDGVQLVRTNSEGVQEIYAWGGPNLGSQWKTGKQWLPYQNITFITPPFAEYVSGHSTYSAAAAEILTRFTESDDFGGCHTQPANSSTFESDTPKTEVKLCWDTFSEAADEAGISRLYGGIHFKDGDLNGRILGRNVGESVWNKTQDYLNGKKQIPEPNLLFGLITFAFFSIKQNWKKSK